MNKNVNTHLSALKRKLPLRLVRNQHGGRCEQQQQQQQQQQHPPAAQTPGGKKKGTSA